MDVKIVETIKIQDYTESIRVETIVFSGILFNMFLLASIIEITFSRKLSNL